MVHSDDEMARFDESQESASGSTIQFEKTIGNAVVQPPRLCCAIDRVGFVKRGAKFIPLPPKTLKNNLLGAVGFLELANAGDFAANIWNAIPVPIYAVVLMAIGGTFALTLSIFAFRDARLSWLNVQVLREERRAIRKQRAKSLEGGQPVLGLEALLDVTFRELGTEVINRLGMGVMLGCGAVLIGVGTFLAIDGADKKVWFASNLLSGYIGNAPIALFGLVNASWSLYVWLKASWHKAAVLEAFEPGDSPVATVVRSRALYVQLSMAASGMASILGGAGSLMTATIWQGYIILIPVIVWSILGNFWWRYRVGYDRPFLGDTLGINKAYLFHEIQYVQQALRAFKLDPEAAISRFVAETESTAAVMQFLVDTDLFEEFCVELLKDKQLSAALAPRGNPEIVLDITGILTNVLTNDEFSSGRLLEVAKKCIREGALRQFQSRERYLAEVAMSHTYFSRSAGRQ